MATKNRDELTAVLGPLMSHGDISLEDILRAAAAAVAENEGVRYSVAVSRVYYWAHCIRAQMDARTKGEG